VPKKTSLHLASLLSFIIQVKKKGIKKQKITINNNKAYLVFFPKTSIKKAIRETINKVIVTVATKLNSKTKFR